MLYKALAAGVYCPDKDNQQIQVYKLLTGNNGVEITLERLWKTSLEFICIAILLEVTEAWLPTYLLPFIFDMPQSIHDTY